jgi:D-alanyl-D-alanine carboxypeptidase/D-alanyl-D-alanine-endopeptidase (penicillin-binding protein 4)
MAWGSEGDGIAGRLKARLEEPRFAAAAWGVKVVSLDSGRTLFAYQAGKFFTPASNAKLFTTALALHQLGGDFRIRTSLYGERKPGKDGVLHGDLILYGRGDPTPLGRDQVGEDPLESLALQLEAAGVRSVEGDLVGDDSFFALPPYGAGWTCDDLPYAYAAEPSALCIHDNTVALRIYPALEAGQPCFIFPMPGHGVLKLDNRTATGPGPDGVRVDRGLGDITFQVSGTLPVGSEPALRTVTVHDPALFFAQLLRTALLRHGIKVGGTVRSMHYLQRPAPLATASLVELGHLEAPPLATLIHATMKNSLNLDAELMLLLAGSATAGPALATESRGLQALRAFLLSAGLKPDEVLLEEGSGLSRADLATPDAIVDLLAFMARGPYAAAFMDSLPVAGVDGTLRDRMRETKAQGRLRAKTGTMRNNGSLSGYVTAASGDHLAFSLMINNYHPAPEAPLPRVELDALAVALTDF